MRMWRKAGRAGLMGLLTVGSLVFGAPAQTEAQAAQGELAGIGNIKVFVTDMNESSIACDLDQGAVLQAFTQALRQGGMTVAESAPYWVVVRATTVASDTRGCLTSLDATVLQNTKYFNQGTREERVGRVQHWSKGGLHFSDKNDHRQQITTAAQDLGNSLVQDWASDQ